MYITDSLIDILFEMSSSPIPEMVQEEARKCILDEIGAMFGGAKQIEDQVRKFLDFQPQVVNGATVIGTGRQASMEHAALLGGLTGHVFDIDDGNRFCALHPGSAVIPAVLAVCDFKKLSMDDLIRGVVVGYEAGARVALCAQPSHRDRGFHASGTCGAIGAAMGCAAALNFGREDMKSALSAAVAASSGLLEMQENVSKLKPYNLGHAAMVGVTAVSLVAAGYNGPVDPLGGRRGFFKALTDEFKTDWLEKPVDGHYCIMDAYHKSYAACRHCHAAIDSTLELRKQVNVDDIEKIIIRIYEQGAFGHDHKECPSIVSAKMSVPYAVALAFATGAAGIPGYNEANLKDEKILSLLDKLEIVVDDELTALVPKRRPAIVEITTKDGQTRAVRTDVARGEPELPMTLEAFVRKFTDLLQFGGKSLSEAEDVCDMILNGNGSVSALTEKLKV